MFILSIFISAIRSRVIYGLRCTAPHMSSAVDIAKTAKAAFEASQLIPSDQRIIALHAIKQALEAKKEDILSANKEDLQVHFLSRTFVNPAEILCLTRPHR